MRARLLAVLFTCVAMCAFSVTAERPTPVEVTTRPRDAPAVLINGRFAPGEWDGATSVTVDDRLSIALCSDRHFLYLGVRFLREMHTGIDLYLAAAGQPPRKLHVSAAIGEAERSDGGWGDIRWGANALWAANSIGLIVEDGKQRTVPLEGFEFQISRAMIAAPSCRLYLHLKRPELRVPATASADDDAGWLEVRLHG